jgi:hypothetical protein
MSMPFGQPSSGDWFKPADAPGHLILITKVHQIGTKFDNLSNGEKPHGVFDMVDLNSPTPVLQQHVNDSHPGIVNKLSKALRTGEMVLGRIEQAPSDKGNPAWVLGPYVQGQDEQYAMRWLQANPLNNFGQPAGQQPAAAPAPAPAPQPQQYAPLAPQQQYTTPPTPQYPPQAPAPQQYAPQQAPMPAAAPPQQQYALPAQAAAPAPQPQQQYQAPHAPPPAGPPMDPNNPSPEVQALLQQIAQNGGQLPAAPPQGT